MNAFINLLMPQSRGGKSYNILYAAHKCISQMAMIACFSPALVSIVACVFVVCLSTGSIDKSFSFCNATKINCV